MGGADLLACRLGVFRVAKAHEGDGGVTAADPLPDMRRHRAVGHHQARAARLAGVGEAVEHVGPQPLGPKQEQRVPPGGGATGGRHPPDQVGERRDGEAAEGGRRLRACPPVDRHYPQPATGQADRLGPHAAEPAQLRLKAQRALKDHPVDGAPAEQRRQRGRLALGQQPGRQVRARVTDLGKRPQPGRDLAHLHHSAAAGGSAEHLDDAVQDGRVHGEVARGPMLFHRACRQRQHVREFCSREGRCQVKARQVMRQHPDGRRRPARRRAEAGQVGGDRAA